VTSDGMGTAEWRSAKSPEYYKRGDYVPGMKVNTLPHLSPCVAIYCIELPLTLQLSCHGSAMVLSIGLKD
jgi:hypothetical protein